MGKPGKSSNNRRKRNQENPFRVKTVSRKRRNAKKSKDMQLAMDQVDDMFSKIQQESKKVKEKDSKEKINEAVTEAKQHRPPQTVEEAVNDAVAQLASTL